MIELIFSQHKVSKPQHRLNDRDIFVLMKISYGGDYYYIYSENSHYDNLEYKYKHESDLKMATEDELGIYVSGTDVSVNPDDMNFKIQQEVQNKMPHMIEEITLKIREDMYLGLVDLFKGKLQNFTEKQQEQFFDELKDL